MRCPDCCKFVSLEFADPEVDSGPDGDFAIAEDGRVTASVAAEVRIVRTCAECSQDMKEATFSMESVTEISAEDAKAHVADGEWRDGCEFEIEADDPEQIEEGGSRYAKSYFGASIAFEIKCACGAEITTGSMSDKVQASGMDECV